MGKNCDLCEKEVKDFLQHLYFVHSIRNPVEYEAKLKDKKEDLEKTERYQNKVIELVNKLKLKEITVEEYRRRLEITKKE